MQIIVCLDDNNGMMFNHRRQSRDALLIQNLTALFAGQKIWMNSYSEALFAAEQIAVADDFLERGDVCFVENRPLADVANQIERLIVYRWNRTYPTDMTLDVDLSEFELKESTEFVGSSHDKITRQIMERRKSE